MPGDSAPMWSILGDFPRVLPCRVGCLAQILRQMRAISTHYGIVGGSALMALLFMELSMLNRVKAISERKNLRKIILWLVNQQLLLFRCYCIFHDYE